MIGFLDRIFSSTETTKDAPVVTAPRPRLSEMTTPVYQDNSHPRPGKPQGFMPTMPDSYAELAKSIGFNPGMILETEVHNFLIEQQIPIYDYAAVVRYMTKLAKQRHRIFVWRPLREIDRKRANYEWGKWNDHDSYFSCKTEVYRHFVPAHILRDVQTIDAKFGERVQFFVADYAVVDPDPFILVTALRMRRIVFGAWDEPEFGVV
jgi:hypothetical protein